MKLKIIDDPLIVGQGKFSFQSKDPRSILEKYNLHNEFPYTLLKPSQIRDEEITVFEVSGYPMMCVYGMTSFYGLTLLSGAENLEFVHAHPSLAKIGEIYVPGEYFKLNNGSIIMMSIIDEREDSLEKHISIQTRQFNTSQESLGLTPLPAHSFVICTGTPKLVHAIVQN